MIVVVGDTLLDVDVAGQVERLSPDAPVPVVDVAERSVRAGGAGLVATLLAGDGEDVTLVTALSSDARAEEIRGALEGVRIVAGDSHAPTPTKTRLRTGDHAIARVDEGCEPPPPPSVTAEMLDAIAAADAIVVADYGRGLAADESLRRALDERRDGVPLVWDPHPKGARPVASATTVTPNLSEALRLSEVGRSGTTAAADAAAELLTRWGTQSVVVTLGDRGALVAEGGRAPVVVPAPSAHVVDPCGAGDRFASALAVALRSGAPLGDAAETAATTAAAFLAAGGVASLGSPAAASAPFGGQAADALAVVARVRAAGGTVVATGGCFDLLHAGHARTLSAARKLGDCLIVCLNSDDSVRRLKGPERPIIGQDDRVDLLNALECVDAVAVFDEDTPVEIIRRLEPDIWVKGGDYSADELPETKVLAEWGGRTLTVPYHPGRSTTSLASALAKVG
ncbi:D-glycero-beta-D-manno-heptose 1-phosphate adenylyltransferase [Desertivibrio insolitus]|uniref:D-glycero-beta-D-manno-heptose 1-phosphate adenylyltransferase n=1 Tax=Herbiconiux sp. SYSU D00978 TaxID=2812562 RepID=UPI001A9770EC|nr:D-glycero-beta-D-manno-heptose 1-phosphate adenylyltransferase [Herbiconiux sp. SYSU D00978]